MNTQENTSSFQDQSRWNDAFGANKLKDIADNPDKYLLTEDTVHPRQKFLISSMGDVSGKKVADLGSGGGEISILLAKKGALVTGVDIGPDLVALAEKMAQVNNAQCDFLVGSITDLQLEDASFDIVVGNAILHHLVQDDVQKSMDEAYRILKPGGTAVFIEPIENSKVFDLIQNLLPVGVPGDSQYRPSILQRKKWKTFLETLDHRAMSDAELRSVGSRFKQAEFKHYGMTTRLCRLFPSRLLATALTQLDRVLTHKYSPLKRYSALALVTYTK